MSLLLNNSIDEIFQLGGNHIVKGIRYQNNNLISSDSSSEMYGGKKYKLSQIDILHRESIDYLKNDLNLSPLEARAYKALAYKFIKNKYPDSTSLARSKIMLSTIKSDNFLDEFKEKLDDTIKIIESIDSEKSKNINKNLDKN